MLETQNLYLYLMVASFVGPLILSFDKKVAFYKNFGPLWKAIFIVAVPFLIWDVLFTHFGIWGFNSAYTSGLYLFGLPLGEYLFFIVIPYCCVFIYEVLNSYLKTDPLQNYHIAISNYLLGFTAALAMVFYDKWYSVLAFGLTAIAVYWHFKVNKTQWLSRFYLAFVVILIPFFLVNGILTGTGVLEEVVWYNDEENMGGRIFTIPVEDLAYCFLLVSSVVTLYEYLNRSRKTKLYSDEPI